MPEGFATLATMGAAVCDVAWQQPATDPKERVTCALDVVEYWLGKWTIQVAGIYNPLDPPVQPSTSLNNPLYQAAHRTVYDRCWQQFILKRAAPVMHRCQMSSGSHALVLPARFRLLARVLEQATLAM